MGMWYCGWHKFRGVPIFVVFVEGPIHEFKTIIKLNTKATNFEPHECVIFVESTYPGK